MRNFKFPADRPNFAEDARSTQKDDQSGPKAFAVLSDGTLTTSRRSDLRALRVSQSIHGRVATGSTALVRAAETLDARAELLLEVWGCASVRKRPHLV